MAGRVGDNELALFGGEEAIRDINCDALLALRRQAVDEQRKVDLLPLRADAPGVRFERCQEEGGEFKIYMEHCEGGSLAKLVNQANDVREVARIVQEILKALKYLHERDVPIAHRDLKPSNVLMKGDRTVKLSDFGESVALRSSTSAVTAGTVRYMSPECVLSPSNEQLQKSDIWSLGILCLELLNCLPNFLKKAVSLQDLKNHFTSFKSGLSKAGRPSKLEFSEMCPFTISTELHSDPHVKAFCEMCLCFDPIERPDASRLLLHPFVTGVNIDASPCRPESRDSSHRSGGAQSTSRYVTATIQEIDDDDNLVA